ncbi:MAG: DUF1987 family protein [Bacteroidia bacterium]|nr:DUF1987 family protein [Bacteroidia bacterium]
MEPILIEATNRTPYVCFDSDKNIFIIEGRSYPEDAFSFYQPILNWLNIR